TGDIAKVTCPVLLLWGDKDLVVLEYMVNETLAALKNATKRVYQGVSHTAITDIPDQFAADVLDFFQ
ncbi:MAG TPA: alpha/beta hydrolase, partial [Bacilli bacterium]|nr:alpha/beta hydrolase [Bacilli bacterium]